MGRIFFRVVAMCVVNIMLVVGVVMPGDWQTKQSNSISSDTLTPRIALSQASLMKATDKLTKAKSPIDGNAEVEEITPGKSRTIAEKIKSAAITYSSLIIYTTYGVIALAYWGLTYASVQTQYRWSPGVNLLFDFSTPYILMPKVIYDVIRIAEHFRGRDKSADNTIAKENTPPEEGAVKTIEIKRDSLERDFPAIDPGDNFGPTLRQVIADEMTEKLYRIGYAIEKKWSTLKRDISLRKEVAPLPEKIIIGVVGVIFGMVVGLARVVVWIFRNVLAPGSMFLLENSLYSIRAAGVKSKPLLTAKTLPESIGMFRITFSSRTNETMSLITGWTFNTVVIGLLKLILTPFFKIKADKYFSGNENFVSEFGMERL